MELPRGKNLRRVGWRDGFLTVQFRGRPTIYIYGPGVAREDCEKLFRVPYPDKLFNQLKAKHNWPSRKVEE
jgi:hypothetical protein